MEHIQSRAKEELLNMDDYCMFEDINEDVFANFTTQKPKVRKSRSSCKNLVAITSRQTKKYLDTQNTKERLKNNLRQILQTEILSQTPTISRVSIIPCMKATKHSSTTSKIPTYYCNDKTSRPIHVEKLPMFSLLKQNNSSVMKKITHLDAKETKKNKMFQQQNSQIRKFIKKKMQQKALEKQQRILPLANTIQNINRFKTLINEKIKTQQTIQQITIKKTRNSQGRSSTKKLKQTIRENGKIQNKQNLFLVPQVNTLRKQKQGTQQSRNLRNILF